jgi:hypothetical protein
VGLDLPAVSFPRGAAGRFSLADRLAVVTPIDHDTSQPETALTLRVYED